MHPTAVSSLGLGGAQDPPDVFCNLGSLIVEGRVPRRGERGYAEGPHVPQPGNIAQNRHVCTAESYMVSEYSLAYEGKGICRGTSCATTREHCPKEACLHC